jgi:hypothetical protein
VLVTRVSITFLSPSLSSVELLYITLWSVCILFIVGFSQAVEDESTVSFETPCTNYPVAQFRIAE